MGSFHYTLLYGLINFIILAAVLFFIGRKMIPGIFAGRRKQITDALNEAEQAQENAKELRAGIETANRQAEEERAGILREAQEAADEEAIARANYDLYHRLLLGLAEEIRPLARKQPDSPCNAYKLQHVNSVLSVLKEELDACYGAALELVDADAALSYSDLSFLLCTYQNLSAAYARRRYGLRYDEYGK